MCGSNIHLFWIKRGNRVLIALIPAEEIPPTQGPGRLVSLRTATVASSRGDGDPSDGECAGYSSSYWLPERLPLAPEVACESKLPCAQA